MALVCFDHLPLESICSERGCPPLLSLELEELSDLDSTCVIIEGDHVLIVRLNIVSTV